MSKRQAVSRELSSQMHKIADYILIDDYILIGDYILIVDYSLNVDYILTAV
jgi:hypothetical protein